MTKLGALWLKEGKKGKFMSGVLTWGEQKIPLVVFKNNRKQEAKHPDYEIFLSEPREQQQPQQAPNDDIPF